jgi:hypothetical protein
MRQIGASVGIAVLGSALNSAYRNGVDDDVPSALPAQAREAIHDNIAGAARAAEKLPGEEAKAIVKSAQDAFVSGMSVVALICAALAAITTVLVMALLPGRERLMAASQSTAKAESMAP